MTALLEMHNVDAAYGPTQILNAVDLVVEERGITTLLGANGAGKTTTLRAICNMMVRVSGEIRFAGERIDGKATEEIVRRGVAHVPDGRGTFLDLTVEENLRIGAYTRRDKGVAADFDRLYGYFPCLKERRRQQAGTLSGGEQQRVAVCRALVPRPALVLADEPTGNLDTAIGDEIARSLVSYSRQNGALVIIATHNRALAELCDRILILRDGRLSNPR